MELELLNTSVKLETDQSEQAWDRALRYALVERLGRNNGGYIAQTCPPKDYNRFPVTRYGENFFGCSENLRELPYVDMYIETIEELVEAHIAQERYGYKDSVFRRGAEKAMARRHPLEYELVHELAEKRTQRIVDEAAASWKRQCDKYRAKYGDVYAEVFGEDAAPPMPSHLRKSNEGNS